MDWKKIIYRIKTEEGYERLDDLSLSIGLNKSSLYNCTRTDTYTKKVTEAIRKKYGKYISEDSESIPSHTNYSYLDDLEASEILNIKIRPLITSIKYLTNPDKDITREEKRDILLSMQYIIKDILAHI